MALRFMDSFDHYSSAFDKYTGGREGSVVSGRHGQGLRTQGADIYFDSVGSNRCIIGGAWFITFGSENFYAVSDGPSTVVVSLNNAGDGALEVGSFGVTARSAADVIKLGQWYYLELDVTITTDVIDGRYQCVPVSVYLDGLAVIDAVTLGLSSPATPSFYGWTGVTHGGFGNISTLDDFYICDGSGPAPWNAPLGDVEIDVIRPNGSGASTQWTAAGSSTNWEATDDPTPDDETTRVVASTVGLSDLYAMEDINTNNGIIGAQLLICARRTEEGFAALTPQLRHAGVTTDLLQRTLSPSYFYRNRDVFVTMPNGDPLTDVNVNALQAGFKRTV